MSTFKKGWLQQGWMRALLFFAVFLVVYLTGNLLLLQSDLHKIIDPEYLNVLLFVATILLVLVPFRLLIDKQSVGSLGFRFDLLGSAMGFLLALLILGIGSLLLVLNNNLSFAFNGIAARELVVSFALMIAIAVSEELVFRGYILNNLLQSFSKWKALGISALTFAFMHTGNPNVTFIAIMNVFVAGLLLGINYIYTKNLWFAIMFHLAWNFAQGPVLGYNVSGVPLESIFTATTHGAEILTGGDFGFEGSIWQTILVAACLFLPWPRSAMYISNKAG